MDKKEHVIRHLEMIQKIVNRLGHDSFLIKGWSMALLVGGIIFIARSGMQNSLIVLAFLLPVFGFWILDGYFVRQERLFRDVYNDFRKRGTTDFEMKPMKHINKPKRGWIASIFSVTLNIFYGIEILFVVIVFLILKYQGGY